MLAQLKTVPTQLAFFRLVEYLEHEHLWVRLQAQLQVSSETRQSILVLTN
jgi:hypothetical protein